MEENPDVKSGFTVRMQFAENPFFSNKVLEKSVDYREDGTVKLSAVPPQWYPGKVHIPFADALFRCGKSASQLAYR